MLLAVNIGEPNVEAMMFPEGALPPIDCESYLVRKDRSQALADALRARAPEHLTDALLENGANYASVADEAIGGNTVLAARIEANDTDGVLRLVKRFGVRARAPDLDHALNLSSLDLFSPMLRTLVRDAGLYLRGRPEVSGGALNRVIAMFARNGIRDGDLEKQIHLLTSNLRELILQGVDLNARDSHGRTALMNAFIFLSAEVRGEVSALLLSFDATDVGAVDHDGFSAFHYADIARVSPAVTDDILRRGGIVRSSAPVLQGAILHLDIDRARYLIEKKGIRVGVADIGFVISGFRLGIYTTDKSARALALFSYLFSRLDPSDRQRVNENGGWLNVAAKLGVDPLVEILIGEDVPAKARDRDGETPLISAIRDGHFAVALRLLRSDLDLELGAVAGEDNAFTSALKVNAPDELIDELLSRNAPTVVAVTNRRSYFRRAIEDFDFSRIDFLIGKGFAPTIEDIYAVLNFYPPDPGPAEKMRCTLITTLDSGALRLNKPMDWTAVNHEGHAPLMVEAASARRSDGFGDEACVILYFIKKNVPLNARDAANMSGLKIAIGNRDLIAANIFLNLPGIEVPLTSDPADIEFTKNARALKGTVTLGPNPSPDARPGSLWNFFFRWRRH